MSVLSTVTQTQATGAHTPLYSTTFLQECHGLKGPLFRFKKQVKVKTSLQTSYEGWNFNSGNYLFTTDTK